MRGFLLAFWLFCIAFVGGERSALAFGAVAFDGASGAFGFSYDARSQSEADRMALARCSGNCAIRARFNRTCLAVSGDINNSYRPYGYGLNNDIVAAQNRAKRECQNRGGDFCVIRARACDQVGPSNPNGTGGNNGSQNGTISYGEDYIRVTSNGVRWLRNYWNDFARCTAWCGKTRDNARNDCAARNQTASIIKCDCNETRRPYFSDVAYTCEAANKVVCKSGPTRTEAARRTETFIFNDNARCSAWCPRAIEGAKQICSSRGGVGAAIHGCNCNETRRPFHARVSFSCSFNSAANCTSQNGAGANANSSLMVLIDVSGSMGQGSKLANAKKAAIAGIKRAMAQGTEVSVAAFSGECNGPLTRHVPFGASEQQLVRFVQGLQVGGGTALSSALVWANRHVKQTHAKNSNAQMIMLLADGENSCGPEPSSVMDQLKRENIIFRHETIGIGLKGGSRATRDLRSIANKTGGNFSNAPDPRKLDSIFLKALDAMDMLDMLGKIRRRN